MQNDIIEEEDHPILAFIIVEIFFSILVGAEWLILSKNTRLV